MTVKLLSEAFVAAQSSRVVVGLHRGGVDDGAIGAVFSTAACQT
jgi:hypothetical protein